jgi:serine/arginine repetitive matrix protein 2
VTFSSQTVLEEFAQQRATRKPSVEIMAVVNALFPAHDLLKNSEDVSLAPYTDAHLNCIRFSLFCHLMGENPSGEKQQFMIQEKVFLWCSLPKYQQAYKAFTQYIEEFKTIETLCFSVLQLAENASSRRRSGSNRSSFTPNSVVMVKSILKGSPQSPREVEEQVLFRRSVSPEFVASAPPVPNPLLKGLPGREVSPSKTDGAAFAFDDPSAPKLRVEHTSTLSKTVFDQHPLAKELNLDSREKAQLGLLLPKQKNRRKF